jgi:hypothetical protein
LLCFYLDFFVLNCDYEPVMKQSSPLARIFKHPVVGEAKQEFFVVGKPGNLLWSRVLKEEPPLAQPLRRPERGEGRRKGWARGGGWWTLLS